MCAFMASHIKRYIYVKTVADPGFPVGGGRGPRWGGAWTPEAVTFRKFCMSKRKNLDPEGGGVRRATVNVDPPLQNTL